VPSNPQQGHPLKPNGQSPFSFFAVPPSILGPVLNYTSFLIHSFHVPISPRSVCERVRGRRRQVPTKLWFGFTEKTRLTYLGSVIRIVWFS